MSSMMNEARSRVPRVAEAAVERARLSVVPRAGGRRAARVPFVVLVSLLLVGGVAGLLFFNTSMQQVSFTATAMEERAQLLDAQRQGLQLDLDGLRDPQRVATRARKMGMVPAATPAFLRLSDGRVLGTPTAATPLDAVKIDPPATRKPKTLRPTPVKVFEKVAGDQGHLPAGSGSPGATGATNPTAGGAAPGTTR